MRFRAFSSAPAHKDLCFPKLSAVCSVSKLRFEARLQNTAITTIQIIITEVPPMLKFHAMSWSTLANPPQLSKTAGLCVALILIRLTCNPFVEPTLSFLPSKLPPNLSPTPSFTFLYSPSFSSCIKSESEWWVTLVTVYAVV